VTLGEPSDAWCVRVDALPLPSAASSTALMVDGSPVQPGTSVVKLFS